MNDILKNLRNSKMLLGEVYFWTDTVKDWKHLLLNEDFKEIIISQLQWLVSRNLIKIYAYVIMPNHLHFIWSMLEKNGKEMPHASFNKWTSSNFLKLLREENSPDLKFFIEKTSERNHRFWQRDPLAILMNTKRKFEQKLNYIHLNPLQEKWNLVKEPEDYIWSSANYYKTGKDELNILTHYMELF